jgi:hypothetical protein
MGKERMINQNKTDNHAYGQLFDNDLSIKDTITIPSASSLGVSLLLMTSFFLKSVPHWLAETYMKEYILKR